MGWLKDYPREYYSKYEELQVEGRKGWFSVYKLPGNVFAIAEPQQFQEVNFFLIPGRDRALLIDTGMGICQIKELVDELYKGEVIAANCHCHFDHIGCNYQYSPVYVIEDELAKTIAARGVGKADVGSEVDWDMFQFGPPEGFKPEDYHVPPYEVKSVEDGYVFDLGDRHIAMIHTPGHTEDHCVFYDEEEDIVFTGDLAYLGALYTHFDTEIFGKGDIFKYSASLNKIKNMTTENTKFYCSHNDLVMDYKKFCEITEAMELVIKAELTGEKLTEMGPVAKGHDYGEEGEPPHVHYFDGFSIFCRPDLINEG